MDAHVSSLKPTKASVSWNEILWIKKITQLFCPDFRIFKLCYSRNFRKKNFEMETTVQYSCLLRGCSQNLISVFTD